MANEKIASPSNRHNFVDITGQRFHRFLVLERDISRTNGTFWTCRCDCGKIKSVHSQHLRNGATKSCGCYNTPNLVGKTFHQLTVICQDGADSKGRKRWKCQCSCGNFKTVVGYSLEAGGTKSCGCRPTNEVIDLAGKKFGLLTVICRDGKKGNITAWECRCDCGSIVTVRVTSLNNGKTKSCGCIRKPKTTICSIEGCGKTKVGRGFCAAHYWHWQRYGDPLKTVNVASAFLWDVVMKYDGEDCLMWPFPWNNSDYYPKVQYKGKSIKIHRAVCEEVHGKPPASGYEVAHSCGRGIEGCCSPRHLRWATRQENMEDKKLHDQQRKKK